MGRNQEQELNDRLLFLIESEDYASALKLLKELNDEERLKKLTKEEAQALFNLLDALSNKLKSKEKELMTLIGNREKVKKAYLK